jgi:hypothetical protein
LPHQLGPAAGRTARGAQSPGPAPPYTIKEILTWADAHHKATEQWPKRATIITEAPNETWLAVESALRMGGRGLPSGSSLAILLAQERGVRNEKDLPPLRQKQILAWADAHFERNKTWPNMKSGAIAEAPGETWMAVHAALVTGVRGCRAGSSLAQLLKRHRGVRNIQTLPPLTEKKILTWADAYHRRTREWPSVTSGPVPRSHGETWQAINASLHHGRRGLPGGSSLAQLLARERGVPNPKDLADLTVEQILTWVDKYHRRTRQWPLRNSGAIARTKGETWEGINAALIIGRRGLVGGSSLPRFLAHHRGVPNRKDLPDLSVDQILAWAEAHHKRTGQWPHRDSGPIRGVPGMNWLALETAFRKGLRGLPGGTTLRPFLRDHLARTVVA